ncbi:MAG: lipid A deacylase LpxR family protein [Alphaproteobacteria bacterium]|nr:lipid A deacylase LpxR family protein [Alphaproteobacteria bacterium]
MRRGRFLVQGAGACMLALLAAAPARADSAALVFENDVLTPESTDRNYTSGLVVSYTFDVDTTPRAMKRLGRSLLGFEMPETYATVSLGQSIFTPQDIEVSALLPDQHPYAGWLYLGGSLISEARTYADVVTLELGVVGPSAGAEQVQRGVHRLINGIEPKGWDHQLKDEPGIHLAYDRVMRARALMDDGEGPLGIRFDVTPSFGASLGNIATEARAGLAVRLGNGVENDFGPPRIRPSPVGPGILDPSTQFRWYVFGGVYGRLVGYSEFLDGNLFRDSPAGVESKPLVGELQAGLVLQWGGVALAYTFVERTEEFRGQDGAQRFGALSLSVGF